ncbi:uncharacterized protein LOC143759897 isoform X2 [Ranitomeya variabilis]|uniref:uncharacterized protein LOC143759897 isoform X2 n=1 Tax=Ranitomeya variabilis TaxID=490064 RepID=UPI004055F522
MELSPHNPTQSHPKPKNNVIETPRTSNLNFLRAKRLNYFCGKSFQNPLLKTETSQDAGETFRTETPRRRLSAPSSSHVIAYSDVPEKMNAEFKAMSLNGETSLQTTEKTKPRVPTFSKDVLANPGKEELTTISVNHTQTLPTTEMEGKEHTKHRNTLNKSTANSLQPTISNPPAPSVDLNLQPVTTKHKKDIPIQQGPQAMLEKAEGKVSSLDPKFQLSHKEVEVKGSLSYHGPMSTLYQVKNDKQIPHSKMKPDLDEFDVLSSHRSLLRSSFVSDLDQSLLDDLSVPETEKLHHVMTWAKKFLDKCNRGELASATGVVLTKNMTEDSSPDSIGNTRITDKHLRLDDYDNKKLPCLGDKVSISLKSPRCVAKRKLKSKETQPDYFLAGPNYSLLQSDHEEYEENFFEPLLVKNSDESDNLNMKGFTDSEEEFIGNIKQSTVDNDDLFGTRPKPNHQEYNTHIFRDIKSDVALNDNYINRGYDSSSPDSCLNTVKFSSTLEDLELKEKGLKNTGDKDGGRTDRTFLVKKGEKSDDNTYIFISGKITGRRQPAVHKVDSNMDLSDGYTRKIYQECPTCSFTNSTSSNWCSECGLALNRAEVQPIRNYELPNPYISDDKDVDDFFIIDNQKRNFDHSMSQKNANKLESAVCWEDSSDVVSDSESSVLDKYFFYVKQLDILRSQEKEQQTKFDQCDHTSETSSDDESSQDYFMLRASGQSKPEVETNTLAPEIQHVGDEAMKDRTLIGFNEHIIGTEGSNVKGLLDRKLQKVPNISSKVTGPKRYWEKSSIAWSSYTHGELKPRSRHSIQRPASADSKKNRDQLLDNKVTEINSTIETARHVQGENNCFHNANEYKNVATAYMKTTNAWAVSEHLCKDKRERSTPNHQRICEANNNVMWLLLPDELWIYIFSLLTHGDVSKVARVCQRFRHIANDETLWKVIKVTNCHSLKDSCLVSIGLHHPESISLYRCHDDSQNITDVGLRQLFQHCKDSLKELNLTNCSGEIFRGDTVLSYASHFCPRLTSVDVSWTGATDKGIISLIQACVCLQSLSMNGCNITDNAITALLKRHYKSLNKLEIFGCHALAAKCLISVAIECVHLENLNIGRIPKATDMCLAKIASNLHKIITLNLTGLNVVRDRAIHNIVKQCSKLENLTLSSCLQVTDVSLMEISTYRPTIKYLDLSGCKKVSDIGIQALARSCQQLRYLDLSSTSTGKRGVCLLASYSYANLECLKLSFCKDVTADAIEKLCKNCKRLKVLHLYGCRLSSDLGNIKKFSKSFQIFHDLSIPTANILGE